MPPDGHDAEPLPNLPHASRALPSTGRYADALPNLPHTCLPRQATLRSILTTVRGVVAAGVAVDARPALVGRHDGRRSSAGTMAGARRPARWPALCPATGGDCPGRSAPRPAPARQLSVSALARHRSAAPDRVPSRPSACPGRSARAPLRRARSGSVPAVRLPRPLGPGTAPPRPIGFRPSRRAGSSDQWRGG
jgi:hypothetical protein